MSHAIGETADTSIPWGVQNDLQEQGPWLWQLYPLPCGEIWMIPETAARSA